VDLVDAKDQNVKLDSAYVGEYKDRFWSGFWGLRFIFVLGVL
jgi:hypothetical protein